MLKSPPVIPQHLINMMRELGPKWGSNIREYTKLQSEAFSEILIHAPKEGIETREIPYGVHSRQVLDVFSPRSALNAPVIIFAHGGAFIEGNKDRTAEIYSNVGWYFARKGVVTINMEYRLAPEFKYPTGVQDVAATVCWTRDNISRFGGNPERIFLFGHSAGAAHVGCYAYDQRFHTKGVSGISGLIVVSGRVRIDNLPMNPNAKNVEAYFGTNSDLMAQGSVVNHVNLDSVPTMISIAEYENPLIDVYCLELAYKLSLVKSLAPRTVWLGGHNHNSSIAHLNTADERLGNEILDFIRLGR